MTLPVPTEEAEQIAVVQYLTMRGHRVAHIPNSTFTKSWSVKNRNKRLGVSAGVPDLLCIISGNVVWLEMKRVKGGTLSQAQKDWIAALEEAGQTVFVAKGADAAINFIKSIENRWEEDGYER